MNVSMADAFNLGWKLAAVLRGQSPSTLLDTYSAERHAKAQELIDFDRDMARLFSEKPKTKEDAARFQSYFKKHGRYTAGVETRYDRSLITGSDAQQALATGYTVGKRFHSAPVIRLGDAKRMELGHALLADGRWRIIVFAPDSDRGTADDPVGALCEDLTNLARRVTAPGEDVDAVIDVRAVYQCPHQEMEFGLLPKLLRPQKGPLELTDYEKVFCPASNGDIFERRGINRSHGAVVVVRPDQYVALVTPVDAPTQIKSFFADVFGKADA